MAIKRVTVEIDDRQDLPAETTIPTSLSGATASIDRGELATTRPEQQEDYQTDQELQGAGPSPTAETIGRTFSDLVFSFSTQHHFMATLLTVVAFVICVNRIETWKGLWLPGAMAFVFNLVWFTVRLFRGGENN